MDIIRDGLILYLDGKTNSTIGHDPCAKTWLDRSESGNNGNVNGCTWNDDGLYFYGYTNHYVSMGEIRDNPQMTLEVIVRLDVDISQVAEGTATNAIMANYQSGGFGIQYDGSRSNCEVYINGAYRFVYGTSVIYKRIYHYTMTYDGFVLKLYENGVLVDKLEIEGSIGNPQTGTPLVLGGDPNNSGVIAGQSFKGLIKCARMYNRALTQEEVTNNYNYDVDYYSKTDITSYTTITEWDVIEDNYVQDQANFYISFGCNGYGYGSYKTNKGKAIIVIATINNYHRPFLISLDPNAVVYHGSDRNHAYGIYSYMSTIEYDGLTWFIGGGRTGSNHYWYPVEYNNVPYAGSYSSVTAMAEAVLSKLTIIYNTKELFPPQIDRIKYVKVREDDGTYSDAILLAVDALNVDFPDNENLIQKMAKKAEKAIYGDDGIHLGRKTNSEQGTNTHALGFSNSIPGDYGVAEGQNNIIYGQFGHTEGQENTIDATTEYGHAEGYKNQVNGNYGHAEGQENIVSGIGAHAEGLRNAATGDYSHAQGQNNVASGAAAAVMGEDTTAEGIASLAIGKGTIAKGNYSFVHGKYNSTKNYDRYAEIVGGGETPEAGDNIYTLDWQGNAKFKGNLTAELFNGKVTKDIKGRDLTSYVRSMTADKNILTYVTGDGTETQVELRGWENVQEKYNCIQSENQIGIGQTEKRIVTLEFRNGNESHIGNAILQSTICCFASPDIGFDHCTVKFRIQWRVSATGDWIPLNPEMYKAQVLCKGYHMINLMQPVMNIPIKELCTIEIWANCVNGAINVPEKNIQTVFYGMGINSGKTRWDGRIDASDHIGTFFIGRRNTIPPHIIFNKFEANVVPYDVTNNYLIEVLKPENEAGKDQGKIIEHIGTFSIGVRTTPTTEITFKKFNAYPKFEEVPMYYLFEYDKFIHYSLNDTYIDINNKDKVFTMNKVFTNTSTDITIDEGLSVEIPLQLDRFQKVSEIETEEDWTLNETT